MQILDYILFIDGIITVWLQPTQKKGATLITLSEKSGYCTQTCTVAAVRGI